MPTADCIVPLRARLGHAEVQRVREALRRHAVARYRQRHGGCFERKADIVEAVFIQQRDVSPRALDHRLWAGVTVFFYEPRFKAAGVHSDADRDVPRAAGFGHGLDVLLPADVAGVDAYLVRAARRRLKGKPVVEVDVRHQRHIHPLLYLRYRLRRAHIRHCDSHDVTARGGKFAYLRRGGLGVPRLGVAHRLHGDLRPAADHDAAHVYSLCVFSFHQPVTILIISLNITYTISASSNTIPAAWM